MRLKSLGVKIGGFDVGLERDDENVTTPDGLRAARNPQLVLERVDQTRRAVERGDIIVASELLVAVAAEFPGSDRRATILLKGEVNAVAPLLVDRAVEDPKAMTTLRSILSRILDQVERYELAARRQIASPKDVQDVRSPNSLGQPYGGTVQGVAAVTLNDVTYRIGGSSIIAGASATIYPGQIVGVIGRNGAGKTTLMRLLAGDLRPTSGSIEYPDLALANYSPARTEDEIVMSSQDGRKFAGTVREVLHQFCTLRGMSATEADETVNLNVARFGLNGSEGKNWAQLSGGMRIRFQLARCSVVDPAILLLDEPLGPLDVASSREYLRQLRLLASSSNRTAVVLSTQDVFSIEPVVDGILLVRDGQVAQIARPVGSQEGRVFEVRCQADRAQLEGVLQRVGPAVVKDRFTHLEIEFASPVLRSDLIRTFVAHDADLHYFRDVTSGYHRLLDDS